MQSPDQPEEESREEKRSVAQQNEDADESEEQEDEREQTIMSQEERELKDTYEKWLRRVRDEPGELLKRKFAHESVLRRQQEALQRRVLQPPR